MKNIAIVILLSLTEQYTSFFLQSKNNHVPFRVDSSFVRSLYSTSGLENDEYCELTEMGYKPECLLPQPTPELCAEEVVKLCMDSLLMNNDPRPNAGLEICFNFSSDRCRAALGGSLQNFIQYASNPTFGSMIGARKWKKLSTGPIIPGTNFRGDMQTVMTHVSPATGRERRFLWTVQRERRPPRQGCWLVHECIFVENAYSLTL